VEITPALASKILKKGGSQRNLTLSNYSRFAADMKAGRWILNGETIVLDEEGRCVDGQHRLFACTVANVPFETFMVTGLNGYAVLDTIDDCKKRSLSDSLKIREKPNAALLAASIRLLWCYENRRYPWVFEKRRGSDEAPVAPSKQMLLSVLAQHPGLEGACRWHNSASRGARKLLPASYTVFLRYQLRRVDEEVGSDFTDRLMAGTDISQGEPLHLLRSRLVREAVRDFPLSPKFRLALAIKAWNRVYEGDDRLIRLSFNPAKESFPRISGMD